MIYIRLEMWPKGDRTRRYLLGEATVTNIGGGPTRGDYELKVSKKPGFHDPCQPRDSELFAQNGIVNFPRKRLNAFDLLGMLLASALHTRWHEIVRPARKRSEVLVESEHTKVQR